MYGIGQSDSAAGLTTTVRAVPFVLPETFHGVEPPPFAPALGKRPGIEPDLLDLTYRTVAEYITTFTCRKG